MTQTATKERAIIFTPESVRAILAGRKTQTRRAIAPQPPEGFFHNGRLLWESLGPEPPPGPAGFRFGTVDEEEDARRQGLALDGKRTYGQGCPYGQPGDRLWVREQWSVSGNGVFYRADVEQPETVKYAWKGPRSMKRKDSRLLLEVTEVRVHPVQEIAEADAEAEGVEKAIEVTPGRVPPGRVGHRTGYGVTFWQGYRELWDSLNAKRGFPWASNPWVWAVKFKVAKA